MLSFCCLCGLKSTVSNFDIDIEEKTVMVQKSRSDGVLVHSRHGLGKPTESEYAADLSITLLDALVKSSQAIPVPGVPQVVEAAVSLIKACRESHATLKRASELKDRIIKLVTILVSELKDKKQIAEDLKKDIKNLEDDLKFIEGKLGEVTSQSRLLLILFRDLNEEKVAICLERLKDSLSSFQLSRHIHDGKVLQQLQRHILDFHTNEMQCLDEIRSDVKKVLSLGTVTRQLSQQPFQSRSPREIPPPLTIFHGRNDLVNKLVIALTTDDGSKPPRLALLGLGGIGKTSTALAVINDHTIVSHFGANRFWVPCVKATSVELLDDTLYTSLGVTQNTNNALHDVISKLLEISTPTLLLLDNFETPWSQSGEQTQIEEILRALDKISHVAILMTMRSENAPCDDIFRDVEHIRDVDFGPACCIYRDIFYGVGQASKGPDDQDLPELLKEVGCMPLAITLLAKTGKKMGWTAGKLLQAYRRNGTAMLGSNGKDPQHNMNSCIRLSMDRLPKDYKQSAEKLLTMLAMLPVGTTLDSLWVRDFHELGLCAEILLDTSLIEKRNDTYIVHPLIRSYILDKSRLRADAVTLMVDTACRFLKQNQSFPGDKSFNDSTKALQAEEINLQAILFASTTQDTNLIEALLILVRHHQATRPRIEVAEYAVQLAVGTQRGLKLHAEALFCHGTTLVGLDRYEEGGEQLKQARDIFLSISDVARAAQCLLEIVDAQSYLTTDNFEEKCQLVEQAESEYKSLSDTIGIGQSLLWSGIVHWQKRSYSEACELLLKATKMLDDRPLYLAHCFFYLSRVYFGMGDYDQGCAAGGRALEQYEQIGYGDHDARIRQILGIEYIAKEKYDDALVILFAALEKYKLCGGPLNLGQAWLEMGRAWMKKGEKEDARGAFQNSSEYYSAMQQSSVGQEGLLECGFYLRWLDNPQSILTSAEMNALSSFGHILDIIPSWEREGSTLCQLSVDSLSESGSRDDDDSQIQKVGRGGTVTRGNQISPRFLAS